MWDNYLNRDLDEFMESLSLENRKRQQAEKEEAEQERDDFEDIKY